MAETLLAAELLWIFCTHGQWPVICYEFSLLYLSIPNATSGFSLSLKGDVH
jgi:hypothetical protein